MQHLTDRITIDDGLCNGKPTIRGLRVTVHTILEYLEAGDSVEDILKEYPMLEADDIRACIAFAAQLMDRKYVLIPLVPTL